MPTFDAGFIYARSFIQKKLEMPSGATLEPLTNTGNQGTIREIRNVLDSAGFDFTRTDMDRTLGNYADTGHCTLVRFKDIEAPNFQEAIDARMEEAEDIIGLAAIATANPGIPLCGFAKSSEDSGIKLFIDPERKIQHATNVPGILDALPAIEEAAQHDDKLSLLLRLYRSSLREREIDNQILFQLILLEEASDNEAYEDFGDRLRALSERLGFRGDLDILAQRFELEIPADLDVIHLLVKLRNSAAHNGNISAEALRQNNGEWVIPILEKKGDLHKLITEAIRYMFCCWVGHTRDAMAIQVTDSIEMRFD